MRLKKNNTEKRRTRKRIRRKARRTISECLRRRSLRWIGRRVLILTTILILGLCKECATSV